MANREIIPLYSTVNQTPMDLLTMPGVGRLLRWRHARTLLQLPLLFIAGLMIWDGFWGPTLAPKNLATVLTWVHYRGLLVLVLLLAGNFFCLACPFMLPRNLMRRFLQPTRSWPRWLRHKWTAIILFVALLFGYELFDLWATPWWTAWLIIAYFVSVLLVDGFFQGASFCKYLCPIGQFNYAASLVSPLEVKVRDLNTCADCVAKDCIKGRADQRGCELWLFQARKVGNMDCTFCLDCLQACPHDNVGILSRSPATELWINRWRSGIGRFSGRPDLAAFVVFFTFGALLNAFGMVSPVYVLQAWLAQVLGTNSEALILGLIFFVGLIIIPMILLGLVSWLVQRWAGLPGNLSAIITRYAYTLLPLGFGIWLAHYLFHFLGGFWTFVPVIQSALIDLGWPILGIAQWSWGPLIPFDLLFPLGLGFISLGCLGSLLVTYHLVIKDVPNYLWQAFLPWASLILLLSGLAVWLMNQPMEMRATVLGG